MDIITEAKAHLEKLRMETSWSHVATMPIPTYEATKDLLSRLVDRLEWRSIESAPRDGTTILTCDMGELNARYPYPKNIDTNEWYEKQGRWGYGATPTHWMPLPLPPVGDK